MRLAMAHITEEHVPASELGKLAAAAHVGTHIMDHFGPGTEFVGIQPSLEQVKRYFTRQVIASVDLQPLCLTKPTTSGRGVVVACPGRGRR